MASRVSQCCKSDASRSVTVCRMATIVDTIPWRLSTDTAYTCPEDIHLLIFVLILRLFNLKTLFHSVQRTIHLAEIFIALG